MSWSAVTRQDRVDQSLPALAQRPRRDVLAVDLEQVEDAVDDRVGRDVLRRRRLTPSRCCSRLNEVWSPS